MSGTLYIVATPIGNLQDITLRAIETLKKVNGVVCEDTRRTGILFNHYQIKKPLLIMNDYNEQEVLPKILGKLKEGNSIALVSDSGTPLISDPGFKLVRECIRENIKIDSIPGASSILTALTLSGLPPDKFLFLGYLPNKQTKRQRLLESLFTILQSMEDKHLRTTIIFYETPHRLLEALEDIQKIFGDIDIVICRELTKLHEEVRRDKISESIVHFQKTAPKGEFTILF